LAVMNLFDLSGKTAVVTGGTRSIGLMIARGLLEAGARVYIRSRKADACAAAQSELSQYGPVTAIRPTCPPRPSACASPPSANFRLPEPRRHLQKSATARIVGRGGKDGRHEC
jgi:NAD(P)-dependent dehydrogenase (short-subunit alcohol dehydrogenase family)